VTPSGAPEATQPAATQPAVGRPAADEHAADRQECAERAAAVLAEATGVARHDVAVVLGSGWRPAADVLGPGAEELPMAGLPGFVAPTAVGHRGTFRSVRLGTRRVLVLLGRTHLYEGHGEAAVAHATRTAAAAGCSVLMLTNAAGGIREGYRVGQPVLVSDHLNLTARSPLTGADFVDLTDLYSPRLRRLAAEIDPTLTEGVYAGLPGPHFETPAEIRMLRTLGADLVGMSTVLEAIAARAAGMEILGVSLVTNLAAGLSGQPLDGAEVIAAGAAAAGRMGELLRELVIRA
jgi:purine-nucleoside phosphorylase